MVHEAKHGERSAERIPFRPVYNQVVVRRDDPPKQIGSIIVPETVRDRMLLEATSGIVVAIGPGRYASLKKQTSERMPLTVTVGDRVWFHREAGTKAKIDDVEYIVAWDDEMMAKQEDETSR